jgi:hypothetical protein
VRVDLLDIFSRASQASASVSELHSSASAGNGEATRVVGDVCLPSAIEGFARSAERFLGLVGWLSGEQARGLEHAQLEARLEQDGRELICALLQDHLDLRAAGEATR